MVDKTPGQLAALNVMLSGRDLVGFEAEVELCRGLAAELDSEPSADLWREYRMALKTLREAMADDGDADPAAVLLERLGGAALRN